MTEIERLEKKLADLTAEVARLQGELAILRTAPVHVLHSHYHYGQPMYAPQISWPAYPQITYGGRGEGPCS